LSRTSSQNGCHISVTPWLTATVGQEALTLIISESMQSLLFLFKPLRRYVYVNCDVTYSLSGVNTGFLAFIISKEFSPQERSD
jgi:hypothetical protein